MKALSKEKAEEVRLELEKQHLIAERNMEGQLKKKSRYNKRSMMSDQRELQKKKPYQINLRESKALKKYS